MLGGDISVSSAEGEGTVFRVTAAVSPADGADTPRCRQTAAESSPPPDESAPTLACRLLLAEDGLDNQRLLAFFLRKAGADVTVVHNGQKAVEDYLRQVESAGPYDAVLMDMQMPVMDGYEATRKLRDLGYAGPILALTAHAMKEDRQKCLDAGCDDYLAKPIKRNVLLWKVAEWLSRRSRQTNAPTANPCAREPGLIEFEVPIAHWAPCTTNSP
jgi:CheY-like chemotaxis protein